MYTPQEVREQSTEFERAIFGGYNMKSVDEFMEPLVEDYSALYKENAVLKSKLQVMVEKLDEYHEREESVNKAILAAQQTADDMIVDTERKCAKMLSDTEETMRLRSQELKKELAIEAERVARAKKTAAAFILHIEEQMHKAVEQLETVRQMSITPKEAKKASPAPVVEAPVEAPVIRQSPEEVSHQIEVSIGKIIGDEPDVLPVIPTPQPVKEPVEDVLGDTMVIHPIR